MGQAIAELGIDELLDLVVILSGTGASSRLCRHRCSWSLLSSKPNSQRTLLRHFGAAHGPPLG
jgi:hypothetical protein